MKPGDILDGRYEIKERLGAGGMGEVYKATHTYLGSWRVIKVVHPHISGNTDAHDRFLREARAATKVQHSNVATLHDFASLPDGAHYMVWEFIDGENLAQRLRVRRTLPPRQAVRIAVQALRGLDAIHRAGIVHRDISPENLMITGDDEVKIIDLGVAKLEDPDAVSTTRTGIFVGKLRYASPEQLGFIPEGERVDGRADLYALAMVLVELLTGRPPYEAKSPHEYFLLHAQEPRKQTVELPRELPGSAALQDVLEKALSRDRNRRYATAREFAAALEEIERTLPEPQHAATLAIPLDGDETMRVRSSSGVATSSANTAVRGDTLQRETLRTDSPASAIPAEPTVRTPLPAAAPPTQLRKGLNPAYAVGCIAVLGLLIGGVLLWPRESRKPLVQYRETTTTPASATAPAVEHATITPSTTRPDLQASLTVTGAPETATLTETTATALSAPVPTVVAAAPPPPVVTTPAPAKPARKPEPKPQPLRETPAEPVEETRPVPKYTDGEDSEDNERALESLRNAMRGVQTVALRAPGMQLELTRAMREEFPNLQFEAYAPVVIRFEGSLDRLGRGRKRRAATAVVLKNDRVVFRYELPAEEYRVGHDPAEAFVAVLADAIR